MRSADHGHRSVGMRHASQLRNDLVERGQNDLVPGTFELQGMAGVVDVFAGARKMHKLRGLL